MANQLTMADTNPGVTVTSGCPAFKTQKILGGRALISDTFSKGFSAGGPDSLGATFGKAFYAHRDGYNVLYGDWSAKWYGDPQQKIMWWPRNPTLGAFVNDYASGLQSLSVAAVSYASSVGGAPSYTFPLPNGSQAVWHLLDVAAGVDVGH